MKRIKLLTISLIMCISLIACGESSSSDTSSPNRPGAIGDTNINYSEIGEEHYDLDDYYGLQADISDDVLSNGTTNNENGQIEKPDRPGSASEPDTSESTQTEKLIYRCEIEVETLDYEESYAKLQVLLDKYGCILQSENFVDSDNSYIYGEYDYYGGKYTEGKYNALVIRVPSDKYFEFLSEYGELGNIISKQQTVENITQEYEDTSAQVRGLKVQLNRLEQMLQETNDIDAMIQINSQITEVQYQINKLTTRLNAMDKDVSFSYVTLELIEVLEYTEIQQAVKTNTFIDRLKNQFVDTWEGFLVFLEWLLFFVIAIIPYALILTILVIVYSRFFKTKVLAYRIRKSAEKEAYIQEHMKKFQNNNVTNTEDIENGKNK